MSAPLRLALRQGPAIGALLRTAAATMRGAKGDPSAFTTPAPVATREVASPTAEVVGHYLRVLGADPKAWGRTLPPHLFCGWALTAMADTLTNLPYDVSRVINGGAHVQANAPIPVGSKLTVKAHIESIDDDGHRAVIHQKVCTSAPGLTDAIVADCYLIMPTAPKGRPKSRKQPTLAPAEATPLASLDLAGRAGLDFALVTGDFNPIHWIPLAGKAAGLGGCILHGFATLGFAWEGLAQGAFSGDRSRVTGVDVRFVRPVKLPGRIRLFQPAPGEILVASAPGAPAVLTGTYTTSES